MWDYRDVLRRLLADRHVQRWIAWALKCLTCGTSLPLTSGLTVVDGCPDQLPSSATMGCSKPACQTRTLTSFVSSPAHLGDSWSCYGLLVMPSAVLEVTGDQQSLEVGLHVRGVDCDWNNV